MVTKTEARLACLWGAWVSFVFGVLVLHFGTNSSFHFSSVSPNSNPNLRLFSTNDDDLPDLRALPVSSVVRFFNPLSASEGHNSHKLQVKFERPGRPVEGDEEEGRREVIAIAKLVEPKINEEDFVLFRVEHSRLDLLDGDDFHKNLIYGPSFMNFQGLPEVMAFHLDRLLGLNNVPFTTGRVLTLNQLGTSLIQLIPIFRDHKIPLGLYDVPVSLQLWLPQTLSSLPPTHNHGHLLGQSDPSVVLTFLSSRYLRHKASSFVRQLAFISDQLVLDFLMDDHDRKNEKNWIANERGEYVSVDNGLAFSHGPLYFPRCRAEILGPPFISDLGEKNTTCLFRRNTVSALQQFRSGSEQGGGRETLGRSLLKRMEGDPLYQYIRNLTFSKTTSPKQDKKPALFAFDPLTIASGIDERADHLLQHVQECISRFGEDTVLAL